MINPERVQEVFMDCLFKAGEPTDNHIKVEGITSNVGFHPERLMGHKEEIVAWLNDLPLGFHEGMGGGWSFLNACETKDGEQWTDFHQRMEQLFQLGIGIGRVKCQMPRHLWSILPGGMPYYMVTKA